MIFHLKINFIKKKIIFCSFLLHFYLTEKRIPFCVRYSVDFNNEFKTKIEYI